MPRHRSGARRRQNELAILEFIHALVETLDRYFENVCELDIMFNLEKAHFVLDEMVMNGCILEVHCRALCPAERAMTCAQLCEPVRSARRARRGADSRTAFQCRRLTNRRALRAHAARYTQTNKNNILAPIHLLDKASGL